MNLFGRGLIGLIRLYQWTLSPLLLSVFGAAGRCRFTPSCSHYAVLALQGHGAVRGTGLAVHRLCRCHPWGQSGEDFPPEPRLPRVKTKSFLASCCHGS